MEATLPSRRTARVDVKKCLQISDLNIKSQISKVKLRFANFDLRSKRSCRVLFLFEDKNGAGQPERVFLFASRRILPRAAKGGQ